MGAPSLTVSLCFMHVGFQRKDFYTLVGLKVKGKQTSRGFTLRVSDSVGLRPHFKNGCIRTHINPESM